MRRLLLAFVMVLVTAAGAAAQTVPLRTPPQPGSSQTANLIFDAMMAVARAASTNPPASTAAALAYRHAVQSYNLGDDANARAQAIQALMEANRQPGSSIPVLRSTIPQTSALQTAPFPLAGASVAQVDADAFVAQARRAVAACRAAKSRNTAAAADDLAGAERDDAAGRYLNVRVQARAAVDLCAAATLANP